MSSVYGSWTPLKDEPPGNPMEVWPSLRAAQQSLHDRLAPGDLTIPSCRTFYLDRPRPDDAQFYGSKQDSGIFLFAEADSPKPYAILEFGARGGVRKRALVAA